MPHAVDAGMLAQERAGAHPMLDLASGHAGAEQLFPRHEAMLARRQASDHRPTVLD